jgi:hypothetical protein
MSKMKDEMLTFAEFVYQLKVAADPDRDSINEYDRIRLNEYTILDSLSVLLRYDLFDQRRLKIRDTAAQLIPTSQTKAFAVFRDLRSNYSKGYQSYILLYILGTLVLAWTKAKSLIKQRKKELIESKRK